MAQESEQVTQPTSDTKHHLLLLTSPLDTVESVEELLDIESEGSGAPSPSNAAASSTHLEAISDSKLLQSLFGQTGGMAVILSNEQAGRVTEYASRHRAVYAMQMVPLDGRRHREARVSALGVGYPVWVFVNVEQKTAAAASVPGEARRPATLTGFRTVKTGSGPSIIERHATGAPREPAAGGQPKRKFRPAQEVLSQLRHDGSLDADAYRVVYEDRFRGEVTVDVGQWASDSTDEEFIPQHRILRFERKWDGVAVWDRGRRTDLVSFDRRGPDQRPEGAPGQEPEAVRVSGMAVQVATGEELAALDASLQLVLPGRLRRAFFRFSDQEGETTNGLVYASSP